ncbi:MAG: flagellar hook-associated protein FlgK [Desulfurella sp.]|jgi:flagellar hook-associated protein 1 FlgK|uniref:Flagellar hook-associated protein 1 n=1 Tax=Desulfurella multipotens TaxID=79269 RepID=A0A1G6J617_9BACT|nr:MULTISPECIES: flagellar hook-associated protein FlgK [Desulfurella]PMP63637.1 MAG: flagellar hook-associated protein FlgK [Desulfurella multipotens]PMP87467.1 MAG: flagellar hook-associated protein FlgK [Desulfurella sp.]SDC13376.1 flagellar hook-associated protein 1 FlgK [Desulfurella multipotens]HEX13070.1 flagellar hook-associated protein FlgK [Desulfurella acetivorans]
MPSIFDGLYIGVSGLNVSQNALNITGNNIANANTPGYTRESPNIVEKYPQITQIGAFGLGAQINSITSARNQLLDNTLNQQLNLQSYYQTLNDQLTQVQNLFNEQNNTGLNTALNNFFNSWQSLSSNPDLATARQQVIQSGLTLSQTIQSTYNSLQQLQNNLYSQMTSYVNQINTLAKNIANINYEIKLATLAPNQTANTLIDQRNQLIQQLQKIANVNVFNTYAPSQQNQTLSTSQEDLTILIGGLPLVSGTTYNKLITKTTNGQNNNVFFQDAIGNLTDITNQISQGSLGAVIQLASKKLPDYMNSLNTLSNSIINQVNILHSGGSGLSAYTQTQSTYELNSASNSITESEEAGVNLPLKSGTLSVNVYDSNNNLVNTVSIPITSNDSFDNISKNFNNILGQYGISMSLSGINQGYVQIISNNGYTFSFAGDTSNFLAAVGINTFFTGTNASNISVNPVIVNDQSKIAAGKSMLPGDNSNALAIANLQTQNVMISNTQTINQYYNAFLGKIGSDVQANQNLLSAQNALVTQTQNLVSSQEGVSLDEEAANLIKYQMAYQASARFISVIEQVTQSLINMVQ